MRIPEIKTHNDDVETEVIHLEYIKSLKYSIEHPYNRDKLIKRIEKIVRQSYEYKDLILFLREEMNLDRCLILSNIDIHTARIELHHDPLRLYDVVDTVLRKHETLLGAENINVFDIADEVMEIHYKEMIPLVPVTTTVHELIHADEVFIPIQLISQGGFGNWRLFVSVYKKYMSPEFQKQLRDYVYTSNKVIQEYSTPILDRRYKYIDCDGVYLPKCIKKED